MNKKGGRMGENGEFSSRRKIVRLVPFHPFYPSLPVQNFYSLEASAKFIRATEFVSARPRAFNVYREAPLFARAKIKRRACLDDPPLKNCHVSSIISNLLFPPSLSSIHVHQFRPIFFPPSFRIVSRVPLRSLSREQTSMVHGRLSGAKQRETERRGDAAGERWRRV